MLTRLLFPVLSASGGIKVNNPKMGNGNLPRPGISMSYFYWNWGTILNSFILADVVVIVAVAILVGLFSLQHYGTDKVGWLFAPVVLLWFLLIGGIGIYNIWKYDSSVLKAFSPVYIYRYFRRLHKAGWISLGGIMLSITGSPYSPFILSLIPLPLRYIFLEILSTLKRKMSSG